MRRGHVADGRSLWGLTLDVPCCHEHAGCWLAMPMASSQRLNSDRMPERVGLSRTRSVLAALADAVQLEPVPVDAIARALGDGVDEFVDVAAGELGDGAAARADDVVLVRRVVDDVAVTAVRPVDAVGEAQPE